jgi:pyruvate/2-oxoglutarate/acetoin dehydrogenase E1 component
LLGGAQTNAAQAFHAKTYAGIGAEVNMQIIEQAFDWLDAPVMRIAAVNAPVPVSRSLEPLVRPDANTIENAVRAAIA